jgi:oligopeptide/dipeptide ABC transporter ATP-binding protein
VSLVGESGCGKSTVSRLILAIDSPSAGRVLFEGAELTTLPRIRMRDYRDAVQAVFQDPWSSLDPRMSVGTTIGEPLAIRGSMSRPARRDRIAELLIQVGLRPEHADRYPHEFSGGQRQRIAVARAVALNPRLVVLDEPVSALDVSIRAQILNLLMELQERYGLGYLLISHQLSTVWALSDLVVVMYLGQFVEVGPAGAMRDDPLHPYTKALIAATPPPHPDMKRTAAPIAGEIPSPLNPPKGCRFHTRCPQAMAQCRTVEPEFREIAPKRFAACHLY